MRQVYLTAQTKHAWWMLANFAKVHDITKCGAYKWITWRLLNIFELKRLFRRNSHMVSVERATICSGCVLFLTSVILWHWYASSDVPLCFPLPLLLQEKRSGAFDFWEGLTVQKLQRHESRWYMKCCLHSSWGRTPSFSFPLSIR